MSISNKFASHPLLPLTSASSAVASGPGATQPAPRRIDQDPAFGAAFDKWVADNQFDTPRPRAKLPEMPLEAAAVAARPTGPANRPANASLQAQPQKRIDQDPGFAAAFDKWVADNQFDVPKAAPQRSSQPAAAARQAPAASPSPKPKSAASSTSQAEAMASLRSNRKRPVNASQAALLATMSQGIADLNRNRASPTRSKAQATGRPAASIVRPAPSAARAAEPRAEVYTDRKRFAAALDRWERDNHFDYDRPMPSGHVAEPRPEFKPSTRIARVAARPSAAELRAQREAEQAAHQEAFDAGYL